MKKTKISLLCLFLAVAVACSASACGNGGGATGNDTSNTISVSNTGSSKYSADNDTKVKQMLDSVTLNGKPLKIPYKLSDSGEGFTFDDNPRIYDDKYFITQLHYNDVNMGAVSLKSYKEGQNPSDFVAVSIGCSGLKDSSMYDILEIDGISMRNTMDDVYSKFGEPTKINPTETGTSYYYQINDDCYVSFLGNEKNNIYRITVYDNNSEE